MGQGMAPRLPFLRRILKHPRAMHYNRLVALVMAINLGWAVYGATAADWWTSDGADLGALHLWRRRISLPPCCFGSSTSSMRWHGW